MKHFLLIYCFLVGSFAFGQVTFEKNYNDGNQDRAFRIVQWADDGYIILGRSQDIYDNHSTYLIRTDSLGDTVWCNYYPYIRIPASITITNDGGLILLGSSNAFQIIVLKLDNNGNTTWQQQYNLSGLYVWATVIVQAANDNYYITGNQDISAGNRDIFLLKLNPLGQIIWHKKFGDAGFDEANDMKVTSDSSFIIAGTSQVYFQGPYQLYVLKINSTGNQIWAQKYSQGSSAFSVDLTFDSGYIVMGHGPMFLMKIGSLGEFMWEKQLSGYQGRCVVESMDKGFYATGDGFYLAKTDSTGNIIWEKNLGSQLFGVISNECIQTHDNGVAVIGNYDDLIIGKETIKLIKTNAEGCVEPSVQQVIGPQNNTVGVPSHFNVMLNYGTDSLNYSWSSLNGQILSGQDSSKVSVKWNQTGTDTLTVIVSNGCGIDTSARPVNILLCVEPLMDSIHGNSVSTYLTDNYFVNKLEGTDSISYNWTSNIANIINGNGTNSVTVEWLYNGTGYLRMIAENACGNDTLFKTVTVVLNSLEEANNEEVTIYTNPSSDGKFIFYSGRTFEKMEVFSLSGHLIFEKDNIAGTGVIDLQGMPVGTYILKMICKELCVIKKLVLIDK